MHVLALYPGSHFCLYLNQKQVQEAHETLFYLIQWLRGPLIVHSSISWQTIIVGSESLSQPISHSQSKHIFVKHLACGGSVEHSRPAPTWPAGHFFSSQTGKYLFRIFVLSSASISFLIHVHQHDWWANLGEIQWFRILRAADPCRPGTKCGFNRG